MTGAAMEREIREQPARLREALPFIRDCLAPLSGRSYEMALLVARGSSDNAALYARYLIEIFLRIPVSLAAPSVLTQLDVRIKYPKCLAIGISQSGAAPDVAEVISSLRKAGHDTVGITNTKNSVLTQVAETVVELSVGVERSVAATKTYTASLLALYELVRTINGNLPDASESLPTDDWVDRCAREADEKCGPVVRASPGFSLGRGFQFSTAHETALKLMECALLPCKAFSTADFEHGPKALAGPGSVVVTYDDRAAELQSQGASIVLSPRPEPTVPPELAPIHSVVFGQMLALNASRRRGLDPDRPPFIQKVTETL